MVNGWRKGVGLLLCMISFFVLEVTCGAVKGSRAEPGAAHLDGMWLVLTLLTPGIPAFAEYAAYILWHSFLWPPNQTTYQGLELLHTENPSLSCCYVILGLKMRTECVYVFVVGRDGEGVLGGWCAAGLNAEAWSYLSGAAGWC